jgi:hypothetical protein
LGAELQRDSEGCLRRRGARRLKLRCRAERLRGQNRLRRRGALRLKLRYRAERLCGQNRSRQRRGTGLRLLLRRRRRGLIVCARVRPQLRGESGQDAVDRINGHAANEAERRGNPVSLRILALMCQGFGFAKLCKPFGSNVSFRLAIFGVFFALEAA